MLKIKLADSFRKNEDDLKGIFLRTYPDFIFSKGKELKIGEIPVFVFHSVVKERFEQQLKYLAENNYKTINADNLLDILIGNKKFSEKTVALTFDDGLGSLWTVAYPLLKKYGFVGISFLIPSLIKNKEEYYPNLEDFWQDKVSIETLSKRETISPFCNWDEIKVMNNSGVIDFQSHSNFHSSVFVSDRLINFVNPDFQPSLFNGTLHPLIFKDGKETLAEDLKWGFPIYEWNANLVAKTRYIESEKVSNDCMEYVKKNGGIDFFKNKTWKNQLKSHWENSVTLHEKCKNFQFPEEREKDIRTELSESKKIIEAKLNKEVKHLCYPWYKGDENSVNISKEVGYKSNFWGLVKGRAINIVGDDPFYIRRITEQFIFSLPGEGRKPLYKILSNKLLSR